MKIPHAEAQRRRVLGVIRKFRVFLCVSASLREKFEMKSFFEYCKKEVINE
jgi:hypothetical protein